MYSFSTENWTAPEDEVSGLMAMFERRIEAETPELHEEGVRIRFIGRRSHPVPPALIDRMRWAEEMTAGNTRITCLRGLQLRRQSGDHRRSAKLYRATPRRTFRAHLYAPDMHDPDLIIRTSGEQRSSNFLLWQGAYSEMVFRDELWPDFSREAFEESLGEFTSRSGASEVDSVSSGRRRRAEPRRSRSSGRHATATAIGTGGATAPTRARRASGGGEFGAAAARCWWRSRWRCS